MRLFCSLFNFKHFQTKNKFEAGGKPSTWFPPGRLVEISRDKNLVF